MNSRRRFLQGLLQTSGALALTGCVTQAPPSETEPEPEQGAQQSPAAGPAPLPDGLKRENFHVHNERPLALETRRAAMGVGVITPLSRFFVRNNLPRPDDSIVAQPLAWSLDVAGVKSPGQITLASLMQLGVETITTVIQCSGNGRKFFEHGPSGSPWSTGAAGCAMWTGVRVSRVLEHFGGALPEARYLTGTGGEPLPEGVERDMVVVERSVPIEKGLQDCMLVWEMNGEPLPISHGGPLRLLVPGYFGCNQIKYVARLAATGAETTAKIQSKGYRFRPIGEGGGPDQPSLWRMPVKSWINGPGAEGAPVLAGSTVFYGVAFSGERGIKTVQVSMDGGESWQPATLTGPDLGPNAWRSFQFRADLSVGSHRIVSRATDKEGEQQPKARLENERGYQNNGWEDHILALSVVTELPDAPLATPTSAPPQTQAVVAQPAELSEQGERGKQVFTQDAAPSCGTCHTLADAGTQGAVGPNLNTLAPDAQRVEAAVSKGVGAMPAFPDLSPEQVSDLATYVVEATVKP